MTGNKKGPEGPFFVLTRGESGEICISLVAATATAVTAATAA